MASKKKGSKIKVVLVCTEDNKVNYVKKLNKLTKPKLEIMKYCNKCRKHTMHKSKDKTK